MLQYTVFNQTNVDYAKINNSVSDAQDVFQNCIIRFTDWFNEKYLGIKTAQSDAVKESDQQAEIDEKEAAKELAEVFDPEGKEKTEDVRKESGNHNHMYYYLHQLLRTRAIDEYRKAHRKQTQSLEGMLKDENGKQSDHNTVLSAGEQYQTEQSLIQWETVNAQYDTMLIDIISQIISLYREMNSSQFNVNQFMQGLNELKSKGGDPNQMIQQMLSSGRITQSQLNMAVNRAQQIMRMLPLGGRQR